MTERIILSNGSDLMHKPRLKIIGHFVYCLGTTPFPAVNEDVARVICANASKIGAFRRSLFPKIHWIIRTVFWAHPPVTYVGEISLSLLLEEVQVHICLNIKQRMTEAQNTRFVARRRIFHAPSSGDVNVENSRNT